MGRRHQVFTPFARAWRDVAVEPPLPRPGGLRWGRTVESEGIDRALAERGRAFGPVGEAAALERWQAFLDDGLRDYDAGRARPDLDGTRRLSVHLKHGEIHPRILLADVHRGGRARSAGARAFETELEPVVDHAEERREALGRYEQARKGAVVAESHRSAEQRRAPD